MVQHQLQHHVYLLHQNIVRVVNYLNLLHLQEGWVKQQQEHTLINY